MKRVVAVFFLMGFAALTWSQDSIIELAQGGSAQDMKAAIALGANVNTTDGNGKTPLIWAAEMNPDSGVVAALLSAKADASIRDHAGWTALDYALANKHLVNTDAYSQLKKATSSRDQEISTQRIGLPEWVVVPAEFQGMKIYDRDADWKNVHDGLTFDEYPQMTKFAFIGKAIEVIEATDQTSGKTGWVVLLDTSDPASFSLKGLRVYVVFLTRPKIADDNEVACFTAYVDNVPDTTPLASKGEVVPRFVGKYYVTNAGRKNF